MSTLSIINSIDVTINGKPVQGWQGTDEDAIATDPFDITVGDEAHVQDFSLATATALKVWDDDTHKPSTIIIFHIVADQNIYVQVIGATSNIIFAVTAGCPFTFTGNTMLAAANTTAMSGSAPTLEEIDSIVIQNNSGTTTTGRVIVA